MGAKKNHLRLLTCISLFALSKFLCNTDMFCKKIFQGKQRYEKLNINSYMENIFWPPCLVTDI